MLYGAPAATLDVLHRAQNNLARVVCQRGDRTDARPLLRSLDWLSVKHRVTYKMAALTFKTMSSTPAYWITWFRQLFQFVLCGHPTPRCWSSQKREPSSRIGLFRSRLRTLGTHCDGHDGHGAARASGGGATFNWTANRPGTLKRGSSGKLYRKRRMSCMQSRRCDVGCGCWHWDVEKWRLIVCTYCKYIIPEESLMLNGHATKQTQ